MELSEQNKKNKFGRKVKNKVRIDLTPMVDLGFLLITFFILTTSLSQPTIARLILPKDTGPYTPVKKDAVITVMLTRNDSIAYFEGDNIKQYCSLRNLRTIIQQKQRKVTSVLGNKEETIVMIYPTDQSTYKNFIDALDEIEINDVKHYYVINSLK